MTYIDSLLEKRNITVATPFWKLHINESELEELLKFIRMSVGGLHLDDANSSKRRELYKQFDREACLMYALWWSHKYDGGKQSWDEPLEDFNIESKYYNYIKEAVLNELKNNKRLPITIFRSKANFHMYLQSILAQGGLPMQLMNGDNISSFENFLYNLISVYENMDMRDWTNISIAQTLAEKYLNNGTLKESDAVLEFAIEIVKAYFNDDDNVFSDYEEIRTIISRIRKKRGIVKKQERKYFRVNWEFEIIKDSIELFYTIAVPYEIQLEEHAMKHLDGSDVSTVSYYVANRLVGTYHRQGTKYILMPGTSSSQKVKVDASMRYLSLIRKIKNELFEERSLINSAPPYMDEPIILQFKNGNWIPKQIKNNDTFACIAPKNWKCDQVCIKGEYKYNGLVYNWFDIDWNQLNENRLVFKNEESGESVCLDNIISSYNVSFAPRMQEWIEESSKSIVVNNDDIRKCMICFIDETKCSHQSFKFFYRTERDIEFVKYTGGMLPSGHITLKVVFPTEGQSKTFSFFNINGLSYERVNNDTIKIGYKYGQYALLANQNIDKLNSDTYRLMKTDNTAAFAPIRFRLLTDGASDTIDIGFTSPIQKSCFIDEFGKILDSGFPISLTELHKYKINLSENACVILSYFEKTAYNTKYCTTKHKLHLPQGRYPLDMMKDEIDRLICINGFNDYRKYLTIKIAHTDAEIKIRRNSYRAQQCEGPDGIKGIKVTREGSPVSDLPIFAIAVNAPKDSPLYHKDDIKMIERINDGCYFLPELEDKTIKEFVVFSDNNFTESNMLAFFLNLGEDMDKVSRDQNKRKSISHIKNLLLAGDEDEWNNTWFYMDIVIKFRLSYFNSFNTFLAIANNPNLLSAFLIRLSNSYLMNEYDENTIVNELQKMEKELSFRFHYLPSECWKNEFERMGKQYEALISEFPALAKTLGEKEDFAFKSFHLFEELIVRQFGEGSKYLLFPLLGNSLAYKKEYKSQDSYYFMKINDALEDFDKLKTPDGLRFPRVEHHNLRPWNSYHSENIIQKLQYLAIVLPQCAAQYVHGAYLNLWEYLPEDSDENRRINTCNEFIRRMINYMSIYASETYNELFVTALLNNPVNQ